MTIAHPSSATPFPMGASADLSARLGPGLAHHRQHGWAIFPAVFAAAEVAELAQACVEAQALAARYPAGYVEGDLRLHPCRDGAGRPYLTGCEWLCYRHPILARYRAHPKLAAIVQPILGPDVKQIKSKIHWKPAGDAIGDVRWHQDCQFRTPAEYFRDLGRGGMQAVIVIDRAGPDHGPLQIVDGSHERGDLRLDEGIDQADLDAVLARAKLDRGALRAMLVEPGDVVTFSPHVIHGSGLNRAEGERRIFINGFCAATSCDIGIWAWRDGRPVGLPPQPHPREADQARRFCHPHVPADPDTTIAPLPMVGGDSDAD